MAEGSTTAASNPRTKPSLAIRFPGILARGDLHSSKPESYVPHSSVVPLRTNSSLRSDHHHLYQSQGASTSSNIQPPQSSSSSLQYKQPKIDTHKASSMMHSRQWTTTSQAAGSLSVVGKSVGTKSVSTTPAATGSGRTKKSSQPPREAAIHERSRSIPTLPKVVSTQQALHQPALMGRGKGRSDGDSVRDFGLPHIVPREKHEL